MEILKKVNGDEVVIEVIGKIDSDTASAFETQVEEMLITGEVKKLEINMAQVTYLSSAGLRVLLSTQKKLKSLNGDLVITNANQTLKEVFEITGFMGILTIL